MNMFKHLGSPDPQGERGGERTREKTLDTIREKMGKEMYESIIRKLALGGMGDLSEEERTVVAKIKEGLH